MVGSRLDGYLSKPRSPGLVFSGSPSIGDWNGPEAVDSNSRLKIMLLMDHRKALNECKIGQVDERPLSYPNVCSLTNRIVDGPEPEPNLELFQAIRLGLFFEEDFNPIGSPDRNSGSEEVCILCPDRTRQRQGRS